MCIYACDTCTLFITIYDFLNNIYNQTEKRFNLNIIFLRGSLLDVNKICLHILRYFLSVIMIESKVLYYKKTALPYCKSIERVNRSQHNSYHDFTSNKKK